jgi:hypothetical protein
MTAYQLPTSPPAPVNEPEGCEDYPYYGSRQTEGDEGEDTHRCITPNN